MTGLLILLYTKDNIEEKIPTISKDNKLTYTIISISENPLFFCIVTGF